MIHEVKLSNETRLYLRQIVRLQMDLLLCAASLQEPLTEQSVGNWLAKRIPLQKAQQISQWLFKRTNRREERQVLQHLRQFAAHDNQAEKTILAEQMRRDVVRLYWAWPQETLECYFPGKDLPDYCCGAKDFLIYFYDSLDDGLDSTLFWRNPRDYRRYGREQFFSAFERQNLGQYVCTICDEHRYMTILRGKYFSDIEHYFPKSIYPHLACHPYNLIPICKQCNTAHLDKDPLQPPNGPRRTLGEIFLPYRAEGVAGQGALKLDWQDEQKRPALEIQSFQDNDDAFYAKLKAFSEIYDIPGRWQDNIDQIGDQLWRYIRHYVRVEIGKDEEIDLVRLKVEFRQLLAYLFEDLGKGPWTYVLIWYLGNIMAEEIERGLQNPEQAGTIPVLVTLREILGDKDDSVATYRSRVNEVLEIAQKLADRNNPSFAH